MNNRRNTTLLGAHPDKPSGNFEEILSRTTIIRPDFAQLRREFLTDDLPKACIQCLSRLTTTPARLVPPLRSHRE